MTLSDSDTWLASLLGDEPDVALMALGSHARGDAAPYSNLDLLLVHRARPDITTVAERIWQPIRARGIALDQSVRTVPEALAMADGDLKSMMGLLEARLVSGPQQLADELATAVTEQWRRNAKHWLPVLHDAVLERHERFGEVAYLLEPDLRDGRGGLRDILSLRAAAKASPVLGDRVEALAEPYRRLSEVRSALHRRTGKAVDRLVLQEQDGVAADLGLADADALMAEITAAARHIAYVSDDSWHRLDAWMGGPIARSEKVIVDPDPGHWLAAAVEAAESGVPLSPTALATLATDGPLPPDPWPASWRNDLVALLGAGPSAIPVLEALDHHGLLTRLLPEWEAVRHRPQRDAYHRFSVDRHLWEAASQAAALTRRVSRPDLLLLAALLHDIGKGSPGDFTEAGVAVVADLAPRLGLPPEDSAQLQELVRLHMLLPEVATRRDLDDPATVQRVADEVGDVDTLELLAALSEADSLATGPAAWNEWKAGLVAQLVERTAALLAPDADDRVAGGRADADPAPVEVPPGMGDGLHGEGLRCTVVGLDRPGLFAKVAGVLALHGLEVRNATAAPSADGRAVEVFDVEPPDGLEPPWALVAADLEAVLGDRLALAERLGERARSSARRYRRTAAHPAEPRVLIDNSASERATVIEVRAPDSVALLYRITTALAGCGLDVRVARISTLGHEVVDAFYVVGTDGQKVTDPEAVAGIESAVLGAVVPDHVTV